MKKLIVFTMVLFGFFMLTACEPQEMEIPDDATVATCTAGDMYKYIYLGDHVYEFYLNDVLQEDSMLNIVQDAVDGAGTAAEYLEATFQPGVCVYSGYSTNKN